MLAIHKPAKKAEKCHPNLLPCKVNHNGPVDATDRYWKPENGTDPQKAAYFRGRKLHGRSVKVPDGYRGSILRVKDAPAIAHGTTHRVTPEGLDEDEEMEDGDESLEAKPVEEVASFGEFTVWGHEATPASAEDPYAMAVEEWMGLAEAIHSSPSSQAAEEIKP